MVKDLQFNFEAIGTFWTIEIKDKNPGGHIDLKKKIDKEISDFVKIFSRFDKKSQIYLSSKAARKINLPEKYLDLVDTYQNLYQLTGGTFTPLVGNLLAEAGYDADYSLIPGKLKPVPGWDEVIEYKPPILETKKPWILDFGAGGKGFLVDLIGKLLENEGFKSYCIDASGDILFKTLSGEPLLVGLEHPDNKDQVIGVAEVKNQSICASAGNRRKWDKYHHIFNPYLLKSTDKVLAVWVIADNGLIADCLATCLFLVEPEKLISNYEFEYLIVYPDFTLKKSSKFRGEIYYN